METLISFGVMMLFTAGIALFCAIWVVDTHDKARDNLLKRFSLSIQDNPYKALCIFLFAVLIMVIVISWPDLKEFGNMRAKLAEKYAESGTGWHLPEINGHVAEIRHKVLNIKHNKPADMLK